MLDRRFWFAASIHKEEDLFCLNTHLKLKQKFPNIITIIAPRHINRVKDIKFLCDKLNLNAQILNVESKLKLIRNKNEFNFSLKFTSEKINDRIVEWEVIDSAGYLIDPPFLTNIS